MLASPAYRQRLSYLRVVPGLAGALVAIAAFFWLPVYFSQFMGSPLTRHSAWEIWQLQAATPLTAGSAFILALLLLFPASALLTLLIGCGGLFWLLPRVALVIFTVALWIGIAMLSLFFLSTILVIGAIIPDLGYWCMAVGFVGIFFERGALARARRGLANKFASWGTSGTTAAAPSPSSGTPPPA